MAPETYFVSISPLFFDPFKPTNCVQSNHKYLQILRKFAHKSPYNFCLLWTQFVDLNGSKNSGEIDTKYGFGVIYFWLCNKDWAHWHLQSSIVWLYELQIIGYQFKSTSGFPTTYKRSATYM